MGPPPKGKKAWRKNINSTEVERFLAEASHQERRGPAVESLQDSDLFFVDTAADTQGAQEVALGQRKSSARSKKLQLRSSVILNEAHKAEPITKGKTARKIGAVIKKDPEAKVLRRPRFAPVAVNELDIWGTANVAPITRPVWDPEEERKAAAEKLLPASVAVADAAMTMRRKLKAKQFPSKVKAVDVDMAGCSYNPEPEAHQDALAALVAAEMRKVLFRELVPKAPPKMVPIEAEDPSLDEVARLQVEAPADEDENEIHLSDDSDEGGGGAAAKAKAKAEKKTQKDRNKEKRRAAQEKQEEERRQLKRQRREIDQLKSIEQQLEEEMQENEVKRQRRQSFKDEMAATLPGRLSRHKFEPASVQVATTDELGGSLRRLKPCPMVALHRYKSLQHRGLIEPRKPVVGKTGKRVEFEKNGRTERAMERQAEIEDMRKARRQLGKPAGKKQSDKAKRAAAAAAWEDGDE